MVIAVVSSTRLLMVSMDRSLLNVENIANMA